MEELGFVGVQVFRRRIRSHGPTAKGDHLFPRRQDREHHAVAKTVVGDGDPLPVHDEAAGLDLVLRHALGRQMLLQRIAAFRCITEAESLDGAARQPAITQIGARLGTNRALELILKELRRQLHDVEQRGAFLFALLSLRVRLRHGDAGHVRHRLHGFGETLAFELGQEAKMVARDAAAEAVVAALAVLAVKARAFLAVEGAAGPVVAARDVGLFAIPRHPTADDGRYRHAVADLVEKTVGKAHIHL